MREDLKNWKVYWPENGRKGQSSESVPHYCRKANEWRCMVEGCYGHRYEERGALEYVMGEFTRYNETYDFNIKENEDSADGWQDHEHSFEGVLMSLLQNPEHFNVDGFEEQYSLQQLELLKAVKKKLLDMGKSNDNKKALSYNIIDSKLGYI